MKNLIEQFKQLWQPASRPMLLMLVFLAGLTGYWLAPSESVEAVDMQQQQSTVEIWTCSMHPQIQQPGPGACPICGMDLIPVDDEQSPDAGPRSLSLSPAAQKLAAIATAVVERRFVSKEIRLAGKIAVDETRLNYIPAHTGGRIERLYVNYTGTTVRKGDHLAQIYSPELLAAQEELLQAARLIQKTAPAGQSNNNLSLQASRDKLRLLGLTVSQIAAIEKSGEVAERLDIFSPVSGVVIDRNASEGAYVKTGSRIFTLADLSKVWLLLDAYETDLPWLRYGQVVSFKTAALPGEQFSGKITFIDPILDGQTRTVKVRVNVDNPGQRLKPEMFVSAMVSAVVDEGGKTADPALAGKWISPMHPEIIKDGPGQCDVCGMDLVRIENLGYVPVNQDSAPLVIPASAPLLTGKRAVVYVALGGGRFEGRNVDLGPRAGDSYVVRGGLKEGESVVVNGAFKLDSDLQIRARPSMMSPADNDAEVHNHEMENVKLVAPEKFRRQLGQLISHYFELHQALSKDSIAAISPVVKRLQAAGDKIDTNALENEARQHWKPLAREIEEALQQLAKASDLKTARVAFEPLSTALYHAGKWFVIDYETSIRRFYCPMAFDDRGAYWLQDRPGVENPYFGAMMYRCGEEVEVLGGKEQ